MASQRVGERTTCRPSLLFVLVIVGIWMNVSNTSYAQQGFLSIDCGYTGQPYKDGANLAWVRDKNYVRTGKTFAEPHVTSTEAGNQSLRSFRYFPDGRSKHCYELPTNSDASYLIRASFYMSETVLAAKRPFQTILSINASDWFTLTSGDGSQSDLYVSEEAIFHSPSHGKIVYFCLRPVIGMPFVSSLELRLLEDSMYSYSGSQMQYLALLMRRNMGVTSTTPDVRFPDDQFDRIWKAVQISNSTQNINLPMPPDNKTRADVYYVPPKVMQDGYVMDGILDSAHSSSNNNDDYYEIIDGITFYLYLRQFPVYLTPAENAFAIFYAENLNVSSPETYTMDIVVDEKYGPSINFSHRASMQANPNILLSSSTMSVQSDFTPPSESGFYPSINAMEVYAQYAVNFSRTDPHDVDAIIALKNDFNLTDWEGDPCTPEPYNWLKCTNFEVLNNDAEYQPGYSSLIQEPCGIEGEAIKYCPVLQESLFLGTTFTVTTLNVSNISASGLEKLTTEVYNNYSSIWLRNLNEFLITESQVNTTTLGNLINYTLSGMTNLTRLDLSNNAIDGIPPNWNTGSLVHLNLSYNQIVEMSSFKDVPFINTLTELDLSNNNMGILPISWNCSFQSLQLLDLSHNKLEGSISSLDSLLQTNKQSLRTLNISHNRFTGPFSSSLYFSSLSNLTLGIFDKNSLDGTLDLSIWHNALESAAASNDSTSIVVLQQLFSFVNNSISAVHPDAETFASLIDTLYTRNSSFQKIGILLGGNPYCKGARSYTQKYLCRYTIDDKIRNSRKANHDGWIIGVSGGIIAFLLCFVTLVTLGKLWKQVRALRKLQQELANRKVQPPYYRYGDLKQATRDFCNDNKLGQGGFGVVYKGVVGDQTNLAVKKLFNSQNMQVMDDFLNEVMLITGIKHRNLVQLKGCCIEDCQRILVYEYAEKGNLAEALWGSKVYGSLNWRQRLNICVGVARGLTYLHEELQPSIIHRDIKPANVLLDKNYNPKIADFGLARYFFSETAQAQFTRNVTGTMGYWSPEYASEGQLSNKADVYSYGIVILEVISGRKCIDHSLPVEQVYLRNWVQTMHKRGMLLEVLQLELQKSCVQSEVITTLKIGLQCIQNDPDKRPSMSQVMAMFLGTREVEVVLDELDNVQSKLQDLLATIDNEKEHHQLEGIVEEDLGNLCLLDQDWISLTSNTNRSSQGSRGTIELSSIQGR